MDSQQQQQNQYRLDAVRTASPEQLTIMLYEAALKSLQDCRDALEQNARDGLSKSQLARDILSALADDVNVEHPHGKTMRDLYMYCWNTILSASISREPGDLDSVEEVLKNLIAGLTAYRGQDHADEPSKGTRLSLNFAG